MEHHRIHLWKEEIIIVLGNKSVVERLSPSKYFVSWVTLK